MRYLTFAFCTAAAISFMQSPSLAGEDRTNYPGLNCRANGGKGRIPESFPMRFENTGTVPLVVYCPIARQSFKNFPRLLGASVEYAEILVSDAVTTCTFHVQDITGFGSSHTPGFIRPEGSTRMLIFGRGTDDVNLTLHGTQSYFFRCTLSPGASIYYYSVTENEGED